MYESIGEGRCCWAALDDLVARRRSPGTLDILKDKQLECEVQTLVANTPAAAAAASGHGSPTDTEATPPVRLDDLRVSS